MSWRIVDPKYATVEGTRVIGVDTPPFTDDIDFESILARAFAQEEFAEWRRTQPFMVVARGEAYDELKAMMSGTWGDVPESAVQAKLTEHALRRNVVVLRWFHGD